MRVLVVYESRYGSTATIAERIAEKLELAGHEAAAIPAKSVHDTVGFDAFVIGSAVYMGSWMKEVSQFVRRNAPALAKLPVWLFSSGPLGESATNAAGQDLREASIPKEIVEFEQSIHPRGNRVFYGALDHNKLGFAHRAIWALPAGRKLLVEGDFRDWNDIEGWADWIAEALAPAHVT